MKYIYLLLLSIFVISCGNKQEKESEEKPKPLMSLVKTHSTTENVNHPFLKDVENWTELKAIDSFFVKFRKISPNEALSNAIELKDLIKRLKDSVKPKKFRMLSLEARINILYSEVLRLADLTEIGAIKAEEVNTQVDKTMSAFSDVNTKINTILTKNNFENEIDIDVKFIGLDTTRIDSISKRAIDLRLKEQVKYRND
ncbi:hypothetical protein [Polaribacter sp. IC073]|uniref:hypothetical protein n=1 Tax=Polaribacter sp. IC073 TaxID=2508540 RepID=UPI0011BDE5A9|nr:hypothetical protein [Polaribacter sp. IC073]TXD47787.1 hypothetical protein ES045_10915 [Polaribacter sp. IC073]